MAIESVGGGLIFIPKYSVHKVFLSFLGHLGRSPKPLTAVRLRTAKKARKSEFLAMRKRIAEGEGASPQTPF